MTEPTQHLTTAQVVEKLRWYGQFLNQQADTISAKGMDGECALPDIDMIVVIGSLAMMVEGFADKVVKQFYERNASIPT
jgi:hypothetical protein